MKHPKKLMFLALAVAMLLGCVFSVAAEDLFKTIEVYTGVNLYMNDESFIPTDVNGDPVEVFIYNGTTYLPARAICNLLDVDVNWDGSTHSVYLGRHIVGDLLLDVCPPYQSNFTVTPETVTMGGKQYANAVQESHDDSYSSKAAYALFNLNGQYSKLSFVFGHVDDSADESQTVQIYLDGKLAYTLEGTADMLPTDYEIDLNGALQMKIEFPVRHDSYALAELVIS